MDNRPIGVFDSGLGGLTAVRRLQELLPNEHIVYFGDNGRVPYGTRSEETIRRYAQEDCRLLLDQNVKYIIAACGTVSSVAPDILKQLPVPAIGVVEATATAADKATVNKRIGIIGTAATIRSRSFETALLQQDDSLNITTAACPMFVPLVENGWIGEQDDVAIAIVRRYMKPFQEAGVDTLILGCTHFPLLAPIIHNVLGDNVTLIDSGEETARRCAAELQKRGTTAQNAEGKCHFFVSDNPEGFTDTAKIFLGRPVQDRVEKVTLQKG